MRELADAIAIFGGARRNGNTGKLIDWVGRELGIEVVDLAEKQISPYNYEHKNIDDDFVPLMSQVLNYNKIILASPIYWYAASAQLKVFIDRTSDFLDVDDLKHIGRKLRGKVGYVVCTSINNEADRSFINSFKDTFEYLGMKYGGHLHANCKDGYFPDNYAEDVDRFVKIVRSSDLFTNV